MFCESVLWRISLCLDSEHQHTFCSEPKPSCVGGAPVDMTEALSFPEHSSRPRAATEGRGRDGRGPAPGVSQTVPRTQDGGWSGTPPRIRQTSPEVDIPWLNGPSGGDTFLVPSSCNSICNNYSDLLIAGEQVMPLSAGADQGEADSSPPLPSGPFLQSSQIPPPMESLPQAPPRSPRPAARRKSSLWRAGSGRDRSMLVPSAGPLSNAQLNAYLEQKLADLYRQYMVESLAQQGSPSAMLGSELILTSVDHITQQLTREQNLEAAKAKGMVISCLLRVASGLPTSGEISTPQLQISQDLP